MPLCPRDLGQLHTACSPSDLDKPGELFVNDDRTSAVGSHSLSPYLSYWIKYINSY